MALYGGNAIECVQCSDDRCTGDFSHLKNDYKSSGPIVVRDVGLLRKTFGQTLSPTVVRNVSRVELAVMLIVSRRIWIRFKLARTPERGRLET